MIYLYFHYCNTFQILKSILYLLGISLRSIQRCENIREKRYGGDNAKERGDNAKGRGDNAKGRGDNAADGLVLIGLERGEKKLKRVFLEVGRVRE